MSKIFEFITELAAGIQIVLSPTIIGFIIGVVVYIYIPNAFGLLIGIFLTLVGLVLGIIIATRAWKKKGTVHLISRVSATPELDDLDETENKTEK